MFEQFSKQARAAIVAAQEAARDAGAPFIDATHVAIGCLAHPKSDACRILQRSGLDPGKVGAQWRRHFSDDKILGHIPFTKLPRRRLNSRSGPRFVRRRSHFHGTCLGWGGRCRSRWKSIV